MYLHCSVKAPEVTFTGEKTALQNQVLGVYRQIESDAWLLASMRSEGSDKTPTISAQKQRVLEAVQNRKFNKDDIDEFKKNKVVGEGNNGFLIILPTDKYNKDNRYRGIVSAIVEEENQDRKIIYDRVISVNQTIANSDSSQVYAIFSKLNIDNSKSGDLIQQADGSWIEKE
jgi:uncharacterized protein YdbL (DUF1318 family)